MKTTKYKLESYKVLFNEPIRSNEDRSAVIFAFPTVNKFPTKIIDKVLKDEIATWKDPSSLHNTRTYTIRKSNIVGLEKETIEKHVTKTFQKIL